MRLDRVDFVFCPDKYLRNLNRTFLNHNYNTDTITFILSESTEPLIGEAYISVDRVKANAKSLKEDYQNEIIRVIIHSSLHLCGFDDKTKKEYLEMTRLQEKYLHEWLVSRETQIGRTNASW